MVADRFRLFLTFSKLVRICFMWFQGCFRLNCLLVVLISFVLFQIVFKDRERLLIFEKISSSRLSQLVVLYRYRFDVLRSWLH